MALFLYAQIQPTWDDLLLGQSLSLSKAYLWYPEAPLEANISDTRTASPTSILTLCGALTVVLDLVSLNADILGDVSTL